MIYIEIPIWLIIIISICYIVILILFIIDDLVAKLIHKQYKVELIEREKENDKRKETNY